MNYAEAMDTMFTLIYEMEEEKYFSEHYDEQLEKCDVFMEKGNVNELSYKQLQEVTEDFGNSHYMMMRAVIESIKKYKEDFEKEKRLKESYKKVNKKQSDKIKELKKEISEQEQLKEEKKEFYEELANKAKEATSIIKNQKHQIHQLEATIETIKCLKEQVDASLKEENEELKEEIKKLKEENKGKGANKGDCYVPSEEEEEYDDLTEQEKRELEKAERNLI